MAIEGIRIEKRQRQPNIPSELQEKTFIDFLSTRKGLFNPRSSNYSNQVTKVTRILNLDLLNMREPNFQRDLIVGRVTVVVVTGDSSGHQEEFPQSRHAEKANKKVF